MRSLHTGTNTPGAKVVGVEESPGAGAQRVRKRYTRATRTVSARLCMLIATGAAGGNIKHVHAGRCGRAL